jgi:hypothetical protein
MSNETKRRDCTTQVGKFSFPHVFRPEIPLEEGKQPQFACGLIFDASADLSELEKMIEECILDKWGKKRPTGLKLPIRDGAEKPHIAGLGAGTRFITARSLRKPPVVDANKIGITDEEKIYGGAYGRLNVVPFAFDKGLSKGVALALSAVQFIRDGEPFGRVVDVDTAFADEPDSSNSGW